MKGLFQKVHPVSSDTAETTSHPQLLLLPRVVVSACCSFFLQLQHLYQHKISHDVVDRSPTPSTMYICLLFSIYSTMVLQFLAVYTHLVLIIQKTQTNECLDTLSPLFLSFHFCLQLPPTTTSNLTIFSQAARISISLRTPPAAGLSLLRTLTDHLFVALLLCACISSPDPHLVWDALF